jgi:hypothetical protein
MQDPSAKGIDDRTDRDAVMLLQPHNVLIADDGTPIVMDLGSACPAVKEVGRMPSKDNMLMADVTLTISSIEVS